MDDEVRRLLDERAIRRRLLEYCRGVDRLDRELVASVYHPDGTDDHGSFKGLGSDFADYVVQRLGDGCDTTTHLVGDSIIDFAGADTAHVETPVIAYQRRSDARGPFLETFGGRYVDRFQRRDGEWKIAHRMAVHDWDKVERVEPAFLPGRYHDGSRDRNDPSYHH
jgi:hypothetical protein